MPVDQFVAQGKVAIDGVMQKQLFFDDVNTLHINAALSSTDATNCYDAVNHPLCNLALQSLAVPMSAIAAYLKCLQTMTFHLKTGFGLATKRYSGTSSKPFMGLTQGSSASPPVWTAVSTLIVNAYKREGHGVSLQSGWSNKRQEIAAILFVDDMDLFHISSAPTYDEEQFIQEVQESTNLWADLLQATGGNLKPAKCYYYLMLWKFEKALHD